MELPPKHVHRVWGVHRLPDWAGPMQAEAPIGEIWFQDEAPDAPLLLKFLFTSEKLSVQVHPNDAQARTRGLPSGKTEAWVVLAAQPGAAVALGLRWPMTEAEARRAALDGSIEQALAWRTVTPGETIFVPAGTIHAIGAGLILLEVQQNADVTYRFYDYGRPRPLSLDNALAVADLGPYCEPIAAPVGAQGRHPLLQTAHFSIERWRGPVTGTTADVAGAILIGLAGAPRIGGRTLAVGIAWSIDGSAEVSCAEGDDLIVAYPGE